MDTLFKVTCYIIIAKLLTVFDEKSFTYLSCEARAPAEEIEGIAGSKVLLPCRIRNVDRLLIVLWFRKKETTPFYSFDARSGNLSGGSGQIHDDILGPRSRLVLLQNASRIPLETIKSDKKEMRNNLPVYPGWLQIRDLKRRDSGTYTCRAEFFDSPTQTHHLKLTVYELPEVIQIVDENNEALLKGEDGKFVIGPIDEGGSATLSCLARGGWPDSKLEWFWRDRLLTGLMEDIGNGWKENRVSLYNLGREDEKKTLECQVSNNPITSPNTSVVKLDMNLRPTSVRIFGSEEGLDAGTHQELLCVTRGSKPAANITWTVSGDRQSTWKSLRKSQTLTRDGATEGRVLWLVTSTNNGMRIRCTATNPRNKEFTLFNETVLNVFHPPIVNLSLGRGLDRNDIKEGSDVYFTCDVIANPAYNKLQFYKEGFIVKENSSKGLLVVERDLVLRNVSSSASGNYSCKVSNVKGESESNGIILNVKYKPKCKKYFTVIGVSEGENVSVECSVNAVPRLVHFTWSVNSTDGVRIIERDKFKVVGQKSFVHFRMPMETKKVELLCLATNVIGEQVRPCITTLVAAGIPAKVQHCSLSEQHSTSLRISCLTAEDLTVQLFVMQVLERSTGHIVVNESSKTPDFIAQGLAPGMDYIIHVFSVNSKGWSPPYLVEGFSLKVAENRMDSTDDRNRSGVSMLFALFLGVVITLVLIIGAVIVAARFRCKRTRCLSTKPEETRDSQQIFSERETDDNQECTSSLLKRNESSTVYGTKDCCEENSCAVPCSEECRATPDPEEDIRRKKRVTYQSNYEPPRNSGVYSKTIVEIPENIGEYTVTLSRREGILKKDIVPESESISYQSPGVLQYSSRRERELGETTAKECHSSIPTPEDNFRTSFRSSDGLHHEASFSSLGRGSPTSSTSLLLPSQSPCPGAYSTSFTLGRCHTRAKGTCTKRPSESFV